MEVCQKNGQSLGEADECGKSLTHFEVCQSVSEVPSPAVYGPSSAFGSSWLVPLSNPRVERNIPRVDRGVQPSDTLDTPFFELMRAREKNKYIDIYREKISLYA